MEVVRKELPANTRKVAVEAIHVSKAYHGKLAIDDLSLRIYGGEVTCILGPSGSGKTTFLRCINELEHIDDGLILVDGSALRYDRKGDLLREVSTAELCRRRSSIGMVFQSFNLFPHLTVLQNLLVGPLKVKNESPRDVTPRALELLARVGLEHRAGSYPSQLSGGQQQRVAIARALCMNPNLLLFDEPTSALDPELVDEVLSVMRDLANDGLTMIVVTHEIGFAREAADNVLFMDGGKLVASGPPDELLNKPRGDRLGAFLSRVL